MKQALGVIAGFAVGATASVLYGWIGLAAAIPICVLIGLATA